MENTRSYVFYGLLMPYPQQNIQAKALELRVEAMTCFSLSGEPLLLELKI